MEKHVGVIAIIINDRKTAAPKVNEILTGYGELVIGRMGIPYPKRNVYVITLIVDGSNDDIGAMCGKIGAVKDVTVKSTLTKCS
jgi:putative iron-only hydrogenase system regulator